ncbi:MAG: alpha/beta fold hydrolase [Chloroflexota bacterium]
MNVLIVMIVILGTLAALYVAFSWVLARLWCKPQLLPVTKSPADFGMTFERVQYYSHGIGLDGWFIPARPGITQPAVIILAHGWCKNAVEMLPTAQLLHQSGFALLLYHARGHGTSGEDGPITILKMAEDIIAGIDYLKTRSDIDNKRLGVLGRSIGGSAAILAASIDRRIRGLVSCSAFADPRALTRDFLTSKRIPAALFTWLVSRFIESWLGTAMDDVAPRNCIGRITAPLLLIHGENDRYVPASNLDILFTQAPQEYTRRLVIPNRGHSDVMRDPKSKQEILEFFNENLQPNDGKLCEVAVVSFQHAEG